MEQLNGGRKQGPEQVLPVPKQVSFEFGYLDPPAPEDSWWDVWVIAQGIAAAEREYRNIDDRTARTIAAQLGGEEGSALRELAAGGEIQSQLHDELTQDFDAQPAQVRNWINWLGFYCLGREDNGPVDGWNDLAPEAERADLELLRRNEVIAHLSDLFGQPVSEELGSADEGDWFGLVRHEGRSGGFVLSRDADGVRQVWETDSDDELQERWAAVSNAYAEDDPGANSSTDRQRRLGGLADLEDRLAPLPGLGDIPHPGRRLDGDSGYEWMEQLSQGWHAEPIWGRDGWNLGAWPLIVVALFIDKKREQFAVATYVEGDLDISRYSCRATLYAAVNDIAEFYWRLGQSRGPQDLPEGSGLLAKHCGPYSDARYGREIAAERTRSDGSEPDE